VSRASRPKLPVYQGQDLDGNVFDWILEAARLERAERVVLEQFARAVARARQTEQFAKRVEALQASAKGATPDASSAAASLPEVVA
jgi:hypothetical protein